MSKRIGLVAATLIEIVGICCISAGITLECFSGADVYYIAITIGSLLIAGGGVMFGKVFRGR